MRYLFEKAERNADGTVTIPKRAVDRWTRQMSAPYSELPESEKESDRKEADKVLLLFEEEQRTDYMKWTISKKFRFEASHQLPLHDGKCRRLHGHSWKMTVTIKGNPQIHGHQTGMIMDYGRIKAIVQPLVDGYLDHYHLNETTGLENPTCELLAEWIYNRLEPTLFGLAAVEVSETCTTGCRFEKKLNKPPAMREMTLNASQQEAIRAVAVDGAVFIRDEGANALAKDATPAKPYPCIESTIEFGAGTYEVRAWIDELEVKDEYDNRAFKNTATACAHLPLGEFARCLAALPRVNAVHVKDVVTGDGIVLYVNWP